MDTTRPEQTYFTVQVAEGKRMRWVVLRARDQSDARAWTDALRELLPEKEQENEKEEGEEEGKEGASVEGDERSALGGGSRERGRGQGRA